VGADAAAGRHPELTCVGRREPGTPAAMTFATAEKVQQEYAGDAERPLAGYLVVMAAYGGLLTGLAALANALGKTQTRITTTDIVMLCLATHKSSRLLAKDAVTSPLRSAFVRYEEPAGDAEINESVRGSGVAHAVGELVTCPFCLDVWTATALTAGHVFLPRTARLATAGLAAIAVSDFLHIGYDAAKQALNKLSG
jgi:hypothetical protein